MGRGDLGDGKEFGVGDSAGQRYQPRPVEDLHQLLNFRRCRPPSLGGELARPIEFSSVPHHAAGIRGWTGGVNFPLQHARNSSVVLNKKKERNYLVETPILEDEFYIPMDI
jgi:hypothetical protein